MGIASLEAAEALREMGFAETCQAHYHPYGAYPDRVCWWAQRPDLTGKERAIIADDPDALILAVAEHWRAQQKMEV